MDETKKVHVCFMLYVIVFLNLFFPGLPEPPIFYISGSASYSSLSPRPRRPPRRPRTILLLLLKAFLTKRSEYIF